MKKYLSLIFIFCCTLVSGTMAFALPQSVHMEGAFQSRNSNFRTEAKMVLNLKKETTSKAVYRGTLLETQNLLAKPLKVEVTVNKSKNKTEGVANTLDGYIAFDAKTAYTFELGQQLTMTYAEYENDRSDFCNPIHDNFCRPNSRPPIMTDRGQLLMTVTLSQ